MVRSCTPPPLSDRKRVLADAHRRQSLALPRPSFSHAVESENDEESDAADYMNVDESPSTERIWGRNAKRGGDSALRSGIDEVPEAGPSSRTYLKSSGSRPRTPERPHARTNLPTWTPLRVPHDSESSRESDSLTATSRRDKQRTTPAPRPRSNTPYNPSKEFRFPKDVIRWLPASVLGGRETTPLQTKPAASPHKSVSNGQNHSGSPQRQIAGPSATSSCFKPTSQAYVAVSKAPKAIEDRAPRPQVKTHSNSGDGWVKDLAAALNRSFVNPNAKGKGKARLPPQNALSDSEESVEADPAQGDLLSSPAIPHPPLPEDSFEDSIWVDEDDDPPRVLSSSTRRTLRRLPLGGSRASAWLRRLDNEDVFESRKAYYVGQKPRRLRIKTPPVKRASSLGTVLAKRKRTINSTSPSYTTNARAQAAAFNAAIAANLRDHSLTPLDSQPATRSNVRDPAQVFAAASANNVNVDRPATTARLPQSSKIGQPSMKRRHTLTHRSAPASPSAFKRRRTMAVSGREASEEVVEGLLDKVPADTTDREENTGEWYLDLDTFIWRRRASGEPTATSATPRLDASPSSAVSVDSPPSIGPAQGEVVPKKPGERSHSMSGARPRGRPRKVPRGETPPKRPRGRPRKYPREETPPKRPRGRPPKSSPGQSLPKRPIGRPRKYPLPEFGSLSPREGATMHSIDVHFKSTVGGPKNASLPEPIVHPVDHNPRKPGEGHSVRPPPEGVSSATKVVTAGTLPTESSENLARGPKKQPEASPAAPATILSIGVLPRSVKGSPAVAVKFPGMGVIDFSATADHVAPALGGRSQPTPSGTWTEYRAAGFVANRETFPYIPLGATPESEDSTLVQHASHSSPIPLQPYVQADGKIVLDDVDDEDIVPADDKIVLDGDDDVLEYIDLSTWGQIKEDAAMHRASTQSAPAATPSVPPRQAYPIRVSLPPQTPPASSPPPPAITQPLAPSYPPPEAQPSHMRELLTLADIQEPLPLRPRLSPESLTEPASTLQHVSAEQEEVLEYQSFDALLASIVEFTSQPESHRGVFAGWYAIIVDEKTKLVEAFVRKIGTQLRRAMLERQSWKYKAVPDSQALSRDGVNAVATVTYVCQCPNRPLVPSEYRPLVHVKAKSCGGFVTISAQEMHGQKVYAGVKGMKITARLRH